MNGNNQKSVTYVPGLYVTYVPGCSVWSAVNGADEDICRPRTSSPHGKRDALSWWGAPISRRPLRTAPGVAPFHIPPGIPSLNLPQRFRPCDLACPVRSRQAAKEPSVFWLPVYLGGVFRHMSAAGSLPTAQCRRYLVHLIPFCLLLYRDNFPACFAALTILVCTACAK